MVDVSVIIPVYNVAADGGEMLRQCVTSAMRQSGLSLEIILVDDGSNDGSGDLCDSFATSGSRIVVVHQENRGVSGARNAGVDRACGRYIFFLDADDAIWGDSLKKLLMAADKSESGEAQIVVGRYTQALKVENHHPLRIHECNPHIFLRDSLYQTGGHRSPWGMLISRALMSEVKFTEGMRYEDLEWYPRLYLSCQRMVDTNILCYYYRQHQASFLHNWSPGRLDVLKAAAMVEDYIGVHAPELLPAARDRRFSANYNIFVLALSAGETTVADNCWQMIKAYRKASLFGRHTRLKNRLGAAVSFLGCRLMNRLVTATGLSGQ